MKTSKDEDHNDVFPDVNDHVDVVQDDTKQVFLEGPVNGIGGVASDSETWELANNYVRLLFCFLLLLCS